VAKAELERATEALVQSQKMTALGTLTAGIAHDFNNILSIIRGSAQIVAANLDDRPKVMARLGRIEAGVEQASSVIQAMLGFSRAGERQPTPCDANAIIDETVRLLGDRFQRELTLRREQAPNLPPVVVARDLVQQILLNLILNAADAMNNRGEIRLVSRRHRADRSVEWSLAPARSPGYVEILIQDHGCGIPAAIRARIFEPFFSTKPFSSRHGTGLGLYMVYEFAREMGLGLRVESQENRGSTFIVALPLQVQAKQPDSNPA
jgi:signal transduction histidine kinase